MKFRAIIALFIAAASGCTPLPAQQVVGDLAVQKTEKVGVATSGTITPAQITANQNNYSPTGLASAAVVRLSSDDSRTITGIVPGSSPAGRRLALFNVGGSDIVLANQSASSTAANRFALNADVTITPGSAVLLQYDGVASRWRVLGGAGSAPLTEISGDIVTSGTVLQDFIDPAIARDSEVTAAVSAAVSDTAYNATSWDGVTTVAPSKNAVRDVVQTLMTQADFTAGNYTFPATISSRLSVMYGSSSTLNAITLLAGELAVETSSPRILRIGDGSTAGGLSFRGAYDLAYNATTWNGSLYAPTQDAVRDWVEGLKTSINSGIPNGSGATVHWSQLTGVPAGFADGTDDGAGGGVAAGDSPTWTGLHLFSAAVAQNTDRNAITLQNTSTATSGQTGYRSPSLVFKANRWGDGSQVTFQGDIQARYDALIIHYGDGSGTSGYLTLDTSGVLKIGNALNNLGTVLATNAGSTDFQTTGQVWAVGLKSDLSLQLFNQSTGADYLSLTYDDATATGDHSLTVSLGNADRTLGINANWTLGGKSNVNPTSPNRTVTVTVAGETIYLHGKTTNN